MGCTALLDACVLYPASLSDLLLTLATTGIFRPKWSNAIHEEWIRNVLASRPDLMRDRLERTRQRMEDAVLDANVSNYEYLINTLKLPDPNDRHVLAAAIVGQVEYIVTYNLKDFPPDILSAYAIAAIHPDNFIIRQIEVDEVKCHDAVRQLRQYLKNPPVEIDELLAAWERLRLHQTAEHLRPFSAFL